MTSETTNSGCCQQVDRPIEESMAQKTERVATSTPAADIHETGAAYIITANVPGADKDSVSLQFDDNKLRLEATAPATVAPVRRPPQKFQRVFNVGKGIDTDKITAEVKHGVVTITLPKAEAVQPKKIAVA